MDEKQFATKIRKAALLLQEVLSGLHPSQPPQSKQDAQKLAAEGICLWCREPIGESSKIRGVHETCRSEQQRRHCDDDVLVEEGRLLEKSTGGRPKKSRMHKDALDLHARLDDKRKGKAKSKRNNNDS